MKNRLALLFALSIWAVAPSLAADDVADIKQLLASYDEAFNAKSLDRLATHYHPDVTIFEGGGVNRGWADYRDHHLGPEMAEFQKVVVRAHQRRGDPSRRRPQERLCDFRVQPQGPHEGA
jgi:hypothetical protein